MLQDNFSLSAERPLKDSTRWADRVHEFWGGLWRGAVSAGSAGAIAAGLGNRDGETDVALSFATVATAVTDFYVDLYLPKPDVVQPRPEWRIAGYISGSAAVIALPIYMTLQAINPVQIDAVLHNFQSSEHSATAASGPQ